ncbi:hypothetical protein D3C81_2002510 [compost metagenome]
MQRGRDERVVTLDHPGIDDLIHAVPIQICMAQQNPFRSAGRTAGIENDSWVVRIDRGRGELIASSLLSKIGQRFQGHNWNCEIGQQLCECLLMVV